MLITCDSTPGTMSLSLRPMCAAASSPLISAAVSFTRV